MKQSLLYNEMIRRLPEVPLRPPTLLDRFSLLVHDLNEHGKYIVRVFPEYTPHDPTLHLEHLFPLADQLLGRSLYDNLNATELVVLAFALYAHDWGMAVSLEEQSALLSGLQPSMPFALLDDEPDAFQRYSAHAATARPPRLEVWSDYLRLTHGLRSGARLRRHLRDLSASFADAVARVAEGHTLADKSIRDPTRYPHAASIFGQTTNLAALAEYVRIVDLLDIGDNRTPYALWKFVQPTNPISSLEWRKHRALSPISVDSGRVRRVCVYGTTRDPTVFASLHDLRARLEDDFGASLSHLHSLRERYDLDLDSHLAWQINAEGFVPILARFECDRAKLLGLLGRELYGSNPYVFLRELLQNSVDAIDTRSALFAAAGSLFEGKILLTLDDKGDHLSLSWVDNGIGMDQHTIQTFLGRAGNSWYGSDDFARVAPRVEPLSRFGIGLLSCFSVTDSLDIRTRRDPQSTQDAAGYAISIPHRDAHFRISASPSVPIGTEVRLSIATTAASRLSTQRILEYVRRAARYIRHPLELQVNGVTTRLEKLSGAAVWPDDDSGPQLRLRTLVDQSLVTLLERSTVHTFYFGSPDGDYEGHYSGLFPKDASTVHTRDYRTWEVGDATIALEDLLADSSDDLYVKGVLAGAPTRHHAYPVDFGAHTGVQSHHGWVAPKVALNLHRPSLVEFDLARAKPHLRSSAVTARAWRDIAARLGEILFAGEDQSLAMRASLMGAAQACGGVPPSYLKEMLPPGKLPVPVLLPELGVTWRELNDIGAADEVLEAPYELRFACSRGSPFNPVGPLAAYLRHWAGAASLFHIETFSSVGHMPLMAFVGSLWRLELERAGFVADHIAVVSPAPGDPLPLACRVWRRLEGARTVALQSEGPLVHAKEAHSDPPPTFLRQVLGDDAPELVRFPPHLRDKAAFGSVFWNVENRKVLGLASALGALAGRVKEGEAAVETRQRFAHLVGKEYLGYVLPSRRTGLRLGIQVYRELVSLCRSEGIEGDYAPLEREEFLEGSIGEYANPYHYDLHAWEKADARPGAPL